MLRSTLGIAAAVAASLSLLSAQAPERKKRTVTAAEVARVHQSAILIDTHNDVTSATVARRKSLIVRGRSAE